MNNDFKQFSNRCVNMKQQIHFSIKSPEVADREVRAIISDIFPNFEFKDFETLLNETVRLFEGKIAGFSGCDTCYHDLGHTMNTMVATARLLHGIHVDYQPVSERMVYLSLIATLYHDSGYIRRLGETTGTGAQFTQNHVQRSIDMLKAAGACRNWPARDIDAMTAMIRCTETTASLGSIEFPDREARLGGHILGTADLISQMADDVYLERLALLYEEFSEGGIQEYPSEYALISKTRDFCSQMLDKMHVHMSNVLQYMSSHFRVRYGVDRDLYQEAVKRNMDYLMLILHEHGPDYRKGLRRSHKREPIPMLIAA